MLDISAVSVVIVIIAICDMPKQEFSLRESVYILNMYMKSRKSCSETREFRLKFPGRRVPNPSTIRGLAKRFKETGYVKNRNINPRRHVLKEERLDDIGERLEHAPQKISKTFIIGNWSSTFAVCTKSNKITEISYTYCEYTHVHAVGIPV